MLTSNPSSTKSYVYIGELNSLENKPVLLVYAVKFTGTNRIKNHRYKDDFLCYVEYDNKRYARNIGFTMAGWVPQFPFEKSRYYYTKSCPLYDFDEVYGNMNLPVYKMFDNDDLVRLFPKLKYLAQKEEITFQNACRYLSMDNKEQSIFESLHEFKHLRLLKKFKSLDRNKQLALLEIARETNEQRLPALEFYYKTGYRSNFDDYFRARVKFGDKVAMYILKNQVNVREYGDHLKLCERNNKTSELWLMPKDFNSKHQEIQELDKERAAKEENDKIMQFNEVASNINFTSHNLNGYIFYVPNKWEDIKYQADTLHQCLISCHYDERLRDHRTILVFVRKDNQPIATAEIGRDKDIRQFYANELDRDNCKPTDEVRELMDQFLSMIPNKQMREFYA